MTGDRSTDSDENRPTAPLNQPVTSDVCLPDGTVTFDIETSGTLIWPLSHGFVRLVGLQHKDRIRVTADVAGSLRALRGARFLAGHNILGFDLIALATGYGLDIQELADNGQLMDTMLTEILSNPPEAGIAVGRVLKEYSLDTLGQRKFGVGKTGSLPKLAKHHGGFGKIPTDDPEYRAYCAGDVNLTSRLVVSQAGARTPYVVREHRVMAIAAQMRTNGLRVDLELLADRVAEGTATRERLRQRLATDYGLPLTDAAGTPYRAPQATRDGKEAIAAAFADLGVTLERTAKSGAPALGRVALDAVRERHAADADVVTLVDTVQQLNGVRSVYDTVERCRIGDRVHPTITPYQASGRWSTSEPGLTVMGKRGGRWREREIFLPEPGHVIITADLAQIDNRMVAAHCQDKSYLDLFMQNRDIHTVNALLVFGDASRRDDAKVLNHGWNYSMGLVKLAILVGSEEMARQFDSTMRRQYPDLVRWKELVARVADSGTLLDNGWGRKLRTTPRRGWTQAPALIGQSAAMDALKEGLLRLPRYIHPMLRAVIHDEIVFSVPLQQADDVERTVIEAMSFDWKPAALPDGQSVRVTAGLGRRGASWGDCYAPEPATC